MSNGEQEQGRPDVSGRYTLLLLTIAFLLNAAWEVLQQQVYGLHPEGTLAGQATFCLPATFGDTAFIAAIYFAGRRIYRQPQWIFNLTSWRWVSVLLAGVFTGVMTEILAAHYRWWHYGANMPRVPGIGVALLPSLQLGVTALAAFGTVKPIARMVHLI